ncbi:MAG TPA: hypothetical protein VG917_01235 [Patescibacteria group bacterium]|nr:hypothetical protein [Patescibacteria group bacterium]
MRVEDGSQVGAIPGVSEAEMAQIIKLARKSGIAIENPSDIARLISPGRLSTLTKPPETDIQQVRPRKREIQFTPEETMAIDILTQGSGVKGIAREIFGSDGKSGMASTRSLLTRLEVKLEHQGKSIKADKGVYKIMGLNDEGEVHQETLGQKPTKIKKVSTETKTQQRPDNSPKAPKRRRRKTSTADPAPKESKRSVEMPPDDTNEFFEKLVIGDEVILFGVSPAPNTEKARQMSQRWQETIEAAHAWLKADKRGSFTTFKQTLLDNRQKESQ